MSQKTSSSLTIHSLEGSTAANTPMEPADPLTIGSKITPDLEKEQPSPSSRPSSPSTPQSTVSNRLVPLYRPPTHRRSRAHSNSLSRRTSGQTTELQNELRRHVSLHGVATNCGSESVMEARKQLDMGGEKGHEEVVIIDWLPNDPNNPVNYSSPRKYVILTAANIAGFIAASNLASCAVLGTWGVPYFEVSREVWVLSITLPMIALAIAPLILAPLSESLGRNMVYQVTSVITAVLFVPQIWNNKSIGGFFVSRFFQGIGMSVSNSMVGGTVADLFSPADRGFPMSLFTLSIFCGQGLGVCFIGWSGQGLSLQWAYGVQAIIATASIIFNIFFMRETRADVLLSWRAKKMTKETGVKHVAAADLERTDMVTLIRVSLIRPLQYLVTEPIVSALSAWIGFAWACIFLSQSSILLVFESYGFNAAQAGSFQTTMAIGAVLGFISQYHQEHLYSRACAKHNGKAPPEARLYWAAYGGLLFPFALYVYAWTGQAGVVHWAVPGVALVFMNWGVFAMYSGVFTYLADAYEIYSSSAQAAQSFCRNIASGIFPLFAHQLYVNLGYPEASTLVASIALLLSAAPILLVFYGKKLRERSKVTSQLLKGE
ncbi:MFS transporter [Cryptococcus gattii Ru294]|nr:MFS transporter [Cryptococcus gattii Ru294]